jgi:hypothetical protein
VTEPGVVYALLVRRGDFSLLELSSAGGASFELAIEEAVSTDVCDTATPLNDLMDVYGKASASDIGLDTCDAYAPAANVTTPGVW